ncbi:class I SAM-dependent methyltransferase [Sphingomonas sp. M6A6_1c]
MATSNTAAASTSLNWRRLVPPSWRMLARSLRQGIPALLDRTREQTDLMMMEAHLSPIARHLIHASQMRDTGLYDRTYSDWRARRIEKILEIYGVDWFDGRKIVELGCGHGDIGAFFADLGAEVLCIDGRIRNVNHAKLRHRGVNGLTFDVCDLDRDFSLLGRFDLMINFGLIYHLQEVDAHLAACFATANDIVLETVVCDSLDPHRLMLRPERSDVDEEALNGIGSRPSPGYIERLAEEAGFGVERHFSADLNSGGIFSYDWSHRDDDAPNDDFGRRRFWRFHKSSARDRLSVAGGHVAALPARSAATG